MVQTWLRLILGRRKSIRWWGVSEGFVSLHICKISLLLQQLILYFLFFSSSILIQTIFRENDTVLEWTFGVKPTFLFTEMFWSKSSYSNTESQSVTHITEEQYLLTAMSEHHACWKWSGLVPKPIKISEHPLLISTRYFALCKTACFEKESLFVTLCNTCLLTNKNAISWFQLQQFLLPLWFHVKPTTGERHWEVLTISKMCDGPHEIRLWISSLSVFHLQYFFFSLSIKSECGVGRNLSSLMYSRIFHHTVMETCK